MTEHEMKTKELSNKVKASMKKDREEGTNEVIKGCFGCLFLIGLVVLFFYGICCLCSKDDRIPDTREDRLQAGFSAWDGSHRGLTERIKSSLHDPSSYEHVETTYVDNGDHLFVKTTFRAKNMFGGIVLNSMSAKTDLNGNVICVLP